MKAKETGRIDQLTFAMVTAFLAWQITTAICGSVAWDLELTHTVEFVEALMEGGGNGILAVEDSY